MYRNLDERRVSYLSHQLLEHESTAEEEKEAEMILMLFLSVFPSRCFTLFVTVAPVVYGITHT